MAVIENKVNNERIRAGLTCTLGWLRDYFGKDI